MLTKLSERIIYSFIKGKIIKEEDSEVYVYGMELLLSAVTTFLIAFIISFITGTLLESTIFLLTFIILRQYTGGYHAKTHFGCIMIFSFVMFGFIILQKLVPTQYQLIISIILMIVSISLIFKFAPVEHCNKPLSTYDKISLREKSITSIFIALCTVIIMIIIDLPSLGLCISLGVSTSTTAMFVEIINHSIQKNNGI